MANQGQSFGMSAEVKRKMDGKRNPEQEQKVREFIEYHLQEPFPSDSYQESLKNGVILCKLLKKFHPGFTKKIDMGNMAFKQRCNIENFVEGCKTFGLQEMELFQVNDLYEGKNLAGVTSCIVAVARHAQKAPGYNGPFLAPKQSDENVREFSDEQLKAGQYTIGLQMGTNKCASQAGQNFGLGRQAQTKPGYNGPMLGPKQSTKNQREFTEEQMQAGKFIHSLQYGSNKGASQAGQNFGKPRQIFHDQ